MRSALELKNHKERVRTCGEKYHAIRQHVGSEDYVVPVARKCHSRFCEDCSRQRRANILDKLRYFKGLRGAIKMELTFDSSAPDPLVDPKYYSHAWDLFLKRAKRSCGSAKFLRIVEIKPGQKPHFHIIVDRFISHEWVTANFPDCGGGKVNWERWLGPDHVFAYITKYVTKSSSADDFLNEFFYLSRMRQFSASRGIYFIVPHNRSFYVVCSRGDADVEFVCSLARRSRKEYLLPLCDIGTGPPDIFLVTRARSRDLFTIPRALGNETRETLRLKRYDQDSYQAKQKYAVYC